MTKKDLNINRPPVWFTILLILLMLPLGLYPWFWAYVESGLLSSVDMDMMRYLIYLLPVYVVGSQWMSYYIYNERKALAWILQVILLIIYMMCLWLYIM